MRGTQRIVIQNKRIHYDFTLKRNLTIIQGNSATGKTTLIEMIQEYYENGEASGIQLHCEKECTVLSGRNWSANLAVMTDSIVFVDEGNEFVFSDEFSAAIQKTDNYYVLVTRESIPSLPYSVEEIYGIRNSGKYGTLKQTYQEFFPIYQMEGAVQVLKPQIMITEDSHAGYQFFHAVAEAGGRTCVSAAGKSNIFEMILDVKQKLPEGPLLIVADGAAFGSEIGRIARLMEGERRISLYLPESFEWLILQSGLIEDGELRRILAAPEKYVESQEYFSWERFFTALLIKKTEGSYLKYHKHTLNPAYINAKARDKILAKIEGIDFGIAK